MLINPGGSSTRQDAPYSIDKRHSLTLSLKDNTFSVDGFFCASRFLRKLPPQATRMMRVLYLNQDLALRQNWNMLLRSELFRFSNLKSFSFGIAVGPLFRRNIPHTFGQILCLLELLLEAVPSLQEAKIFYRHEVPISNVRREYFEFPATLFCLCFNIGLKYPLFFDPSPEFQPYTHRLLSSPQVRNSMQNFCKRIT